MTTDKSSVRILIYNDCGTENFLNVFFPVTLLEFPKIKRRCLWMWPWCKTIQFHHKGSVCIQVFNACDQQFFNLGINLWSPYNYVLNRHLCTEVGARTPNYFLLFAEIVKLYFDIDALKIGNFLTSDFVPHFDTLRRKFWCKKNEC